MKQYYYLNAQGQQMPPVDFEGLRQVGITPDTMVWFEGLTDWKRAAEIPELQTIVGQVPPTYYGNNNMASGQNGQQYGQPSQLGQQQQFGQQPYAPGQMPGGYPQNQTGAPSSYLWLGILTTLFCCLPFGIVSIVYASKVDSYWARGLQNEAIDASNKAKTWGIVAAIVGFVFNAVYVAAVLA